MNNITVGRVANAIVDKATKESCGRLTVVEEERDFFEYACGVIDDFIVEINAEGFDVEFKEQTREILITIISASIDAGSVNQRFYDIMCRANRVIFGRSEDGGNAYMTLFLPGIWEEKN